LAPTPQVEPTVGVPAQLKNEDKLPAKKHTNPKRTSGKKPESKVALRVNMDKKEMGAG